VIAAQGYYTLNAALNAGGVRKASGFDDIYAVEENPTTGGDGQAGDKGQVGNNGQADKNGQAGNNGRAGLTANYAVLEKDHIVADFLKARGIDAAAYTSGAPKTDVIIVGDMTPGDIDKNAMSDLMKRVENGTKLIVLENADLFARQVNAVLGDKPPVFKGGPILHWGGSGRLFVGQSPMLSGLPQAQGMSWEYQCFYKTTDPGGNAQVSGIRLNNVGPRWIVALGNQGNKEILASLAQVPVGQGSVVLSTLSILPNLQTDEWSAVVAKRLFLNLLK
jgi:hypothetical protein